MNPGRLATCALLLATLVAPAPAATGEGDLPRGLVVTPETAGYTLSLDGQAPFHRTGNEVIDPRLIEVPGTPLRLALWSESLPAGGSAPYYAIGRGGEVLAVRRTSYELALRYARFDPVKQAPAVGPPLVAAEDANLYLVQFVTQPLEEFRSAVVELGGTVHKYVANHAHFVEMTPGVRNAVAALPFVRWVGPVHPAYKLEEEIRDQLLSGARVAPRRYSIMLHRRGPRAQEPVARRIEKLGGEFHGATPQGFRIEATLTLEQLREVAALDAVTFIDRKGPLETDVDLVRQVGGADHVESIAGFSGQGVRVEVADTELDENHPEWPAPPLIHVPGSGVFHGTSVYGILFSRGANPQARGLIPDGVGIFAYSDGLVGGGPTRYEHTAELVDPDGPYRAVLQTNSTGDPRTEEYTTISAEMDDLLFLHDIAITQSQSNAGSRNSRPQAWAKNVISGGAVYHYDTATRDDDCWCGGASIGPASDGRIKPDLSFFYDSTFTTASGGIYTQFGGTSGATPSIAGYLGLFFQMWSEELFGNDGAAAGGPVFDNRPHMTTAKAALINTARPYPFSGADHDLTRVHQGWGVPDLRQLYEARETIAFIDETELLRNLERAEFVVYVEPGAPELRLTMVYADPMGSPAAAVHRVNDLSLAATSPSGVTYRGNHGLLEGNWSTPGGDANDVDTVENVFVQGPEGGVWAVEVIASEINEDGHLETAALDADFALVASGGYLAACSPQARVRLDAARYGCAGDVSIRVVDCDLNGSDTVIDSVAVRVDSSTEPGGETVLLVETAAETADFRGSIALSALDADGVLQVAEGDQITLNYLDEDDGQGGVQVEVTDTAAVDCTGPAVVAVRAEEVRARRATIAFDTDEPAVGRVRYGTDCAALDREATRPGFTGEHRIELTGLSEETTWFYAVEVEDEAGNAGGSDNGGACHSFTTTPLPDYFTELFTENDVDRLSLVFTPDGSGDHYRGCAWPIDRLPFAPAGGTILSLEDDDSATIGLEGGATVRIYGSSFGSFRVGSNGYVTFDEPDGDYSESLSDHFNRRRVSALFDDLDPSAAGTVSWKQLADRAVVTWEDVPEFGTSDSNTFQVELRFDGTIVISFLDLAASDGLAGLSAGLGVPDDFESSDLSGMACVPTCDDTVMNQGESLIDCGGPCPPCACLGDADCDDGLFCDGAESCDDFGDCLTGAAPCPAGLLCDDSNDRCVTPFCNEDTVCDFGEDCAICGGDCFSGAGATCGNGVCEAGDGENCRNCPADCAGSSTGKPGGRFCCGFHAPDSVGCLLAACHEDGYACAETPAVASCCGDLFCATGEDAVNCAVDCAAAAVCGDALCVEPETPCGCPHDCGDPPTFEAVCVDGVDEDCDGLADCDDRDCGDDPGCATCDPRGAACGADAQCCSGRCHRGACK